MVLLGLKAHVPLTTLESFRAGGNNAFSAPYGSFGSMAPTSLIAHDPNRCHGSNNSYGANGFICFNE